MHGMIKQSLFIAEYKAVSSNSAVFIQSSKVEHSVHALK